MSSTHSVRDGLLLTFIAYETTIQAPKAVRFGGGYLLVNSVCFEQFRIH